MPNLHHVTNLRDPNAGRLISFAPHDRRQRQAMKGVVCKQRIRGASLPTVWTRRAGLSTLFDVEVMHDQTSVHGGMGRDGMKTPHMHPSVSGSHREKRLHDSGGKEKQKPKGRGDQRVAKRVIAGKSLEDMNCRIAGFAGQESSRRRKET